MTPAEAKAAEYVARAQTISNAVRAVNDAVMAMLWMQFAGIVASAVFLFIGLALLIAAVA